MHPLILCVSLEGKADCVLLFVVLSAERNSLCSYQYVVCLF